MSKDSSESHASHSSHHSDQPALDWETVNEDKLVTDEDGTYYTEFDPEQDNITYTITMALADTTDRAPKEVPPLSDYVDPDALHRLFDSRHDDVNRPISVYFTVSDRKIVIYGDGQIVISPHVGDT